MDGDILDTKDQSSSMLAEQYVASKVMWDIMRLQVPLNNDRYWSRKTWYNL